MSVKPTIESPDDPESHSAGSECSEPAIKLADEGGIESLSMRNVAQELGVYPMALYNHFANKDDLLDAMVDVMYEEIDATAGAGRTGKGAMRQQANVDPAKCSRVTAGRWG